MDRERQRLFVAVPLPEESLPVVRSAQEALPAGPNLRLLGREQLHVTLAFMGEVEGERAAAARAVVEAVPAAMGGTVSLGRFLLLPSPGKARVVTLEIEDGDGVLAGLYSLVMNGLEAKGVMCREKRPFRPHLTVARLRTPGPVRPRYESARAPFAVQSVCLFQSELRREGAVYTVVARKALVPASAEERA